MDSQIFQVKANVNGISSFPIEQVDYLSKKLRLEVYLFLISRKSEDDYFQINNSLYPDHIIEVILNDLETAGWKYALSFGDTGLFIFTNDKPKTCW